MLAPPAETPAGLEKEIRLTSFVPRWSIVKTLRQQTLDQHCYQVAIIAWRLVEDCFPKSLGLINMENLFKAALLHDTEEVITSDLPSPVNRHIKANLPGWKEWVQAETRRFFPWYEEDPLPATKAVVAIADLLEAILYLIEEEEMGNRFITPHLGSLLVAMKQLLDRTTFEGCYEDLLLTRVKQWVYATMRNARKPAKVLGDFRT